MICKWFDNPPFPNFLHNPTFSFLLLNIASTKINFFGSEILFSDKIIKYSMKLGNLY